MKKLTLDIDALTVQSFATHPVAGAGTVHGAADLQQQFQPVTTRNTYPNCSEIDACPSALGCTYQDTCSLCPQSAGCPVSDGAGFN
ncbi:MAG TPA: hypothetical protein VFQ39_00670, partial [Longimicrobium sp.]|nr:hypothetical protein [Longimicrobium sp.]